MITPPHDLATSIDHSISDGGADIPDGGADVSDGGANISDGGADMFDGGGADDTGDPAIEAFKQELARAPSRMPAYLDDQTRSLIHARLEAAVIHQQSLSARLSAFVVRLRSRRSRRPRARSTPSCDLLDYSGAKRRPLHGPSRNLTSPIKTAFVTSNFKLISHSSLIADLIAIGPREPP